MSPLRMVAIFSSTKKSVFLCGALFALNFNPDTVQAAITKGPYPQNVTTDAVTIMWETDFWDDQSELTYWQPGDASHVITAIAPAATHEVTFSASQTESNIYEVRLDTGLLEETKGFYHIVSASDVASGTFTTASSTSTNFRFAVYGDSRWGTETHHQILESILHQHSPSNPISFFLHTGDLVSSGLFYGGWHSDFFPAAGVAMSQIPFYPVLGNHELMGGDFLWYYFFFDLPDNGSGTEEESWYSFDYGNAHVIGLDTNMDARDTAYATVGVHDFRPGSKQYDWLIDDLSSARSGDGHRHLFVSLHHPPYSSGRHGVVEATEPPSVPRKPMSSSMSTPTWCHFLRNMTWILFSAATTTFMSAATRTAFTTSLAAEVGRLSMKSIRS